MPAPMAGLKRLGGRRAVWVLLALTGCAAYSASFGPVERNLAAGQPARALEALEAQRAPSRDRLLYLLNKALLLRETGDIAGSTEQLEEAKRLVDALSAVSLTEQSASLLLNDAARSYEGEPFEQVLIHVYAALNYLELGRLEEARVEALQVDLRQRLLAGNGPDALPEGDPLARYLGGLIYEERAEWSDALISYRKAYEVYKAHERCYGIRPPAALKTDLIRLAGRLDLREEQQRYRADFGIACDPPDPLGDGRGEVVFLLHNGLAPVKRERFLAAVDPGSGLLVSVNLPRYERRGQSAAGARLTVGGVASATEVVEDVGSLAIRTLQAREGAITARALARAGIKYAAARATQKENNVAGAALSLFNALTERADTRSWLTLPEDIQMARVSLSPGRHDLCVEVLGPGGTVVQRKTLDPVTVRGGRRTYVSYRWISP